MNDSEKPKRKCGFAAMSPERQREVASKGGKAAQGEGGHGKRFDPAKASEHGRLGGIKIFRERGSDYYREMGRKGGRKRMEQLAAKATELKTDFPEKAR